MTHSVTRVWVVAGTLAALLACNKSNPVQPTVVAPALASPSDGAQIRNSDQPVTLIVSSGISTQSGATYTFEVATDAGFATRVQTKDGISGGAGGQTEVKLDSRTPGAFSGASKFTIGPAVTVSTPSPIAPLTNAQTSPRPALRVTNVTATGSVGAITYKFEIATSAAFTTLIASVTVTQGINETGYIPTSDLPTGTILFWRATAIDASSGTTSSPSGVQSFTAIPFSQAERIANQLGIVLWPGNQPPGSVGHATMGETGPFGVGWQVQTLHYRPENVTLQSPDAESLRLFDLLDRGLDPDAAIGWMVTNRYPTNALWYPPPEKAVIGLHYVYLASRGKVVVNSTWDVVLRVE